jgi:glutamate formiminotransferase
VGARPVLVAYNVWIARTAGPVGADGRPSALTVARSLAEGLRGPAVRSLGLEVGTGAQVSFNLIDPATVSVVDVYDAVAVGAESNGCSVLRAELVGLIPDAALRATPRHRWAELDLEEERTIEGRLASAGHPIADLGGKPRVR